VCAAIIALKQPRGSSKQAITKHLKQAGFSNSTALAKSLKKGLESKVLVKKRQSYCVSTRNSNKCTKNNGKIKPSSRRDATRSSKGSDSKKNGDDNTDQKETAESWKQGKRAHKLIGKKALRLFRGKKFVGILFNFSEAELTHVYI
jgi:hypothetical protein